MINPPLRGPREEVGGLYYFGRMIDKIRLHLRGDLPDEYQPNFGLARGLDGLLSQFLSLNHSEIVARVKKGGTDEEILQWCFSNGLRPNEIQIRVWNSFAEKVGWRDPAAATVERVREAMGPAGTDIATIFDCIDAGEGRPTPLFSRRMG
jgi:gluconokinase